MRKGSLGAVCVILIAAACGKQGDSGKPDGTAIGSGGAVLTVPPDTEVPRGLTVTAQSTAKPPDALMRYSLTIGAYYDVLAVVDVGPATATLARPSGLAVAIDPTRLAKGRTTADITAVQVQPESVIADVPVRVFGPQRIDVTIEHGGTVLLLAPHESLTVIGKTSQAVRGSSELLVKGDCASWITAGSPRVAALAKDPAGLVIGADHSLVLGTKLAGGGPAPDLLHADQILERGTADSDEASVVLASLLLAKGHPVRLVSGRMAYELGGVRYAGVGQWAEVVLEGAPWFVDLRDLAKPRLIPAAQATVELSLAIGRACAAYPPGVSTAGSQWEPTTTK